MEVKKFLFKKKKKVKRILRVEPRPGFFESQLLSKKKKKKLGREKFKRK